MFIFFITTSNSAYITCNYIPNPVISVHEMPPEISAWKEKKA